ncbi:MAG: hypothetical protein MUF61_00910 [archaeon]|nr:hypothetical protein [archaeon]
MQKRAGCSQKLILFSGVLIAVILLISVVSAFSWGGFFAKITGKAVADTCADSDGGKNYNDLGTTSGPKSSVSSESVTNTDKCKDATSLQEYYCLSGSNWKYVASTTYKCPHGCENGMCKSALGVTSTTTPTTPATPTPTETKPTSNEVAVVAAQNETPLCSDSDGGLKYELAGKVIRNGTGYDDRCTMILSSPNQTGGYAWINGAYYNYHDENGSYFSECTGDNCYLIEADCNSQDDWNSPLAVTTCALGCKDGACIAVSCKNVTVLEGFSNIETFSGTVYNISIAYISADAIALSINGENSANMAEGAVLKIGEGAYIGVRDILFDDRENGTSSVYLALAPLGDDSCLGKVTPPVVYNLTASILYSLACDASSITSGSSWAGLAYKKGAKYRDIDGKGTSSCIQVDLGRMLDLKHIELEHQTVNKICGDSCDGNCNTPAEGDGIGLIFANVNNNWKYIAKIPVARSSLAQLDLNGDYGVTRTLLVCRGLSGASRDNLVVRNLKVAGTEGVVCSDSDSGKNFFKKGSACLSEGCTDDMCLDSRTLIESYLKPAGIWDKGRCSASGTAGVSEERYDCPQSSECIDGACTIPTGCIDSDSGANLYVASDSFIFEKLATGDYRQKVVNDGCVEVKKTVKVGKKKTTVTETKLSEAICGKDGKPALDNYDCPNGCVDGKCYYPGIILSTDKNEYNDNEIIYLKAETVNPEKPVKVDLYVQPARGYGSEGGIKLNKGGAYTVVSSIIAVGVAANVAEAEGAAAVAVTGNAVVANVAPNPNAVVGVIAQEVKKEVSSVREIKVKGNEAYVIENVTIIKINISSYKELFDEGDSYQIRVCDAGMECVSGNSNSIYVYVQTTYQDVCKDSDGLNLYKKGKVSGLSPSGGVVEREDYCRTGANGDSLVGEFYCTWGTVSSVEYSCPQGCKNGACEKIDLFNSAKGQCYGGKKFSYSGDCKTPDYWKSLASKACKGKCAKVKVGKKKVKKCGIQTINLNQCKVTEAKAETVCYDWDANMPSEQYTISSAYQVAAKTGDTLDYTWDRCSSETILNESICESETGKPSVKQILCPQGCLEGRCQRICAMEGEFTSDVFGAETQLSCCEGLTEKKVISYAGGYEQGIEMALCYNSSKGEPSCNNTETTLEGWYYPSGELVMIQDCRESTTCIAEGEYLVPGFSCCEGLTRAEVVNPCGEKESECPVEISSYCTACGDGSCTWPEDPTNCAADCTGQKLCEDSDGGIDFFTRGSVNADDGEVVTITQITSDEVTLNVVSAEEAKISIEDFGITNILLTPGANVTLGPYRARVDKINYVSKGNRKNSVKLVINSMEDSCLKEMSEGEKTLFGDDSKIIFEAVCNDNGKIESKTHVCKGECKNGVCNQTDMKEVCEDSDGGLEAFAKGFVEGFRESSFVINEGGAKEATVVVSSATEAILTYPDETTGELLQANLTLNGNFAIEGAVFRISSIVFVSEGNENNSVTFTQAGAEDRCLADNVTLLEMTCGDTDWLGSRLYTCADGCVNGACVRGDGRCGDGICNEEGGENGDNCVADCKTIQKDGEYCIIKPNKGEGKRIKVRCANMSDVEVVNRYMANLIIKTQSDEALKGYTILSGINLSEGETKTAYMDKLEYNSNSVCIKDAEIENISEISPECDGENETVVMCPGKIGDYECAVEGNTFVVSGLRHSGVLEYTNATTITIVETQTIYVSSGGGGGGGGGSTNLIRTTNTTTAPVPQVVVAPAITQPAAEPEVTTTSAEETAEPEEGLSTALVVVGIIVLVIIIAMVVVIVVLWRRMMLVKKYTTIQPSIASEKKIATLGTK